MVVLGGSCLVYILLRRDKTVRVYKRQGSTDASPEPRESSQTASNKQQDSVRAYPEDEGAEKPR
jgi:hypothetical protein